MYRIPIRHLAVSIFLTAAASAQVVVRQHLGGVRDLVEVGDVQGAVTLLGIQLEDCELVGYAKKDRLRSTLPRPGNVRGLPDHVMLPQGGSLWRATSGADQCLLQVTAEGRLRTHLRVPLLAGGIAASVSVSPTGEHAVVHAGGQVWRLDCEHGDPASSLTAPLGSLSVDADSLRVNGLVTLFVASDVLYRCVAGGTAQPLDLPLIQDEVICEELVLAAAGTGALVVVERDDHERRLLAILDDASVQVLTSQPVDLPQPSLDEELGPFIAISPDGARAAWRLSGASEELYVACLQGGAPQHVTALPEYPLYIDNIGVLAFGTPNRLCFFGGDRVLSGVTDEESIGAADMYAVTFDAQCGLTSRNVSGTSGSFDPPFTLAGTMTLEGAVVDPRGERFLVTQEPLLGEEFLSSFPIGAVPGQQGYGAADILVEHEDFEFYPVGDSVLVVTEFEQGIAEDTRLSLIPPHGALAGGAGAEEIFLASYADGTTLQQVAVHGQRACVRLMTPSGPVAHWLTEREARFRPVLPAMIGGSLVLSGPVTFDADGTLHAGVLEELAGRQRWIAVSEALVATRLRVPARQGFFLPY